MTSTSAVNGNHSLFEDIVRDEVSPNVAKSCKRTSAIFNSSDSSDSDDDMYSNYLNKYTKKSNVENKSRNFITVADMHEENVKYRSRCNSLDLEDSLLEEDDHASWQQRLEKRARKAHEEEEKQKRIALEELEQIARVVDVEPGAKPTHYYCTPALEDAERNIRCMRDRSSPENFMHLPVSNSEVSCEFRDVTTVSLMVKDLENATTRSEILTWEFNKPLFDLRNKIAKHWNCNPENVKMTITVNDVETVISEEATPKSLKLQQNRIAIISIFRIDGMAHDHYVEKNSVKNTDMIYLKYQLRNTKPTLICVKKDQVFSDIKKKIQMHSKLTETIMQLVFDDREICDNDTPEDLGMENNDCIDVYT